MTARTSVLMGLAWGGSMFLGSIASAEAMNLLFFGNSFSQQNHLTSSVRRYAEAEGYDTPLVVDDLAGGGDVDYYIDRVTNSPTSNVASPLIEGKTFDYVIIQGNSNEATHLDDPQNDFIPDSVALSQLVRSQPSGQGTKVVMFETWARGYASNFYTGPNPYFPSPAMMQDEIRTNYNLATQSINLAAGEDIATVAPVGTAWESTDFNAMFYDFEGYHPSLMGTRLAGLVLYRTIFNEMVSDIPYSAVSFWTLVSESEWTSLTYIADSFTIQSRGDFDLDGDLDAADIDLLFGAHQGAVSPALPEFDLNFNISVNSTPNTNASDADVWVRELKQTEYGDINLDGVVNFNDLLVVAQNYNTTTCVWAMGNIDGQAGVSFGDLLLMAQNYGFGTPDVSMNVSMNVSMDVSMNVLGDVSSFDANFAADWSLAQSMIPEPTALGIMWMAFVLRRRR